MLFLGRFCLFLFLLLPIYIISSLEKSNKKDYTIFFSIIISVLFIIFIIVNFNQIFNILSQNSEIYFESDKGDGVIGNLQKIPFLGSFLAIFYNAIQPLPFWIYFNAPLQDNRPEMYNIMTFPLFFSSLFNWFTLVAIITFSLSKKIKNLIREHLDKTLVYLMFSGLIFLYIQAAVIDQRRLMAYYVIFYIFAFIIFNFISKKDKISLIFITLLTYSAIQLIAFLIKY